MLIVLVSSPRILKFFLQHRSHLLLLLLPACVQLSSVDNNYAVFFANGELNESVFIWLTWTSRSFFKSSSYQAIGNLYYQKSNFAPLPSSDLTVGLSEWPFAKNMHNTVLYSHCRGAEEPRVADPCVEPYLFDVLDVFVSHVATVSITFSCPLETLPLSFPLFATRLCNVLCCVVKLMNMFSYFACVLTTCMCFLKLLCVELSGPPYIYTSHTTLLWLVVGLSNWAKRHFFSWFGWNTPHNHSPMEQYQTHILTTIMSMTTSG